MREITRKWNSVVSGECPNEPRTRSQETQRREENGYDQSRYHGISSRIGLCGIEEYLDNWKSCWGLQGRSDISNAEEDRDAHPKAENSADDDTPNHSSWNHNWGVVYFFGCVVILAAVSLSAFCDGESLTHVRDTVNTRESICRRQKPNTPRNAITFPATVVRK